MTGITHVGDCSDRIDAAFVEGEQIPGSALRLGIQLCVAGTPFSNTVFNFDNTLGGEDCWPSQICLNRSH